MKSKSVISEINDKAYSDKFILEYDYLIDITVKRFIRSGAFHHYEFEDIKQSVREKLILKKEKIKTQYQGIAQFRNYLSVVIQNFCREIIRSRKEIKTESIINEHDINTNSDINSEFKIIIEQEIQRLRYLIDMYYKQKPKVILCLKLKYRMPIIYNDFYMFDKNITRVEYQDIKKNLSPYYTLTEKQLNGKMITTFNKTERKTNSPDSIRKFTKLKINELIEFLNGTPKTSYYTEETFQILFEKYYEQHERHSV
jgi:hypothetical protein